MQRIITTGLTGSAEPGMQLVLEGDMHHYLYRVMRLRVGDSFVALPDRTEGLCSEAVLRNPGAVSLQNPEFVVRVTAAGSEKLRGEIEQVRHPAVEPPLYITVAQALIKGDNFETVVQKATELGCFDVVPLQLRYCDVRLDGERATKRVSRWQAIAREAAEQSGRTHQPLVHPVMEPAELVDNLGPPESREDLFLALWAQEGRQGLIPVLQQAAESVKRLVIVVGPEGGLHEDELHLLKQAGFVPVSFGPRILRAETAAIAGLSVVLSRLGDLGSVQS